MPKSRISINIHGQNVASEPKLMDFLTRTDPTVVLVLNNEGLGRRILHALPDALVVLRNHSITGGDDGVNRKVSPERWMELRAREADGGLWLYVDNEPSFDAQTVDWNVRLMNLAAERNVHLVVGNWSTGTPTPDAWGTAIPMLDAINQHPDLFMLGLHEYAGGVMTSGLYGGYPDNAGVELGKPGGKNLIPQANWPLSLSMPEHITTWHCGRFRFLEDYCKKVGISMPRVMITEHGMDFLSDIAGFLNRLYILPQYKRYGFRGLEPQWREWWSNWSLDEAYYEQLAWADRTIYNHPNIAGQCIFCYGHSSSDWEVFDIEPYSALQDLLAAHKSYGVTTSPPVPAPTPEPPPPPPGMTDEQRKTLLAGLATIASGADGIEHDLSVMRTAIQQLKTLIQ